MTTLRNVLPTVRSPRVLYEKIFSNSLGNNGADFGIDLADLHYWNILVKLDFISANYQFILRKRCIAVWPKLRGKKF